MIRLSSLLVICFIALVSVIISTVYGDLFLPVTKGLSGHFYVQESVDAKTQGIRCYDLAKRTSTVFITKTSHHRNMDLWDVSQDNTRFVAVVPVSKSKSLIRRYQIRNGQLVETPGSVSTMSIPGTVDSLSLTPHGNCCVVQYSKTNGPPTTVLCDLVRRTTFAISSITCCSGGVMWDHTGRWFLWMNDYFQQVLYDMKLRRKTLPHRDHQTDKLDMVFSDEGTTSPDGRWRYIGYENTDPYLKNTEDHRTIRLKTNRCLQSWSPDSEGFLYYRDSRFRNATLYYDIKSGRSYRLPIPPTGRPIRWVR